MVTSTVPITIGTSLICADEFGQLAHAGQGEHLLDEHRSTQQAEHRQAEHGQTGSGRVAQNVPEHDCRSLMPRARSVRT